MQTHIARAQNSSNLASCTDRFTHDTETLSAVGIGASRLASLLLRIKNADQDRWMREAVLLIAKSGQRHKISQMLAIRIAHAALIEWAHPHCRACNGAGSVQRGDGGAIQCWRCDGAGVHRYTDSDRADMIQAAYKGRIVDAYRDAMSLIARHIGGGLGAAKIFFLDATDER